jgi:type II secretory pathway pseudopilin PulG
VSRWSDGRGSSSGKDDGFSLIEVVVALGILMVLVTALLPQLVVGIRATSTARLVTQAKGMAQAELESMRNLPYHVSYDAGDFRDVLDYYYKDLDAPGTSPVCRSGGEFAPPQLGWTGYVAPTAARCSYEPATGAFYRTVRQVPAAEGISAFTIVVSTQFLSGSTPPTPVTPPTSYDTQSSTTGEPASSQIGAAVTVLYTNRATLRPTSTSTQIARQPPVTTRIRADAVVSAVDMGSVTAEGVPITLSAGQLSLNGSLTHASHVGATLAATAGALATGEKAGGASATVSAPPSRSSTVLLPGAGSLGVAGCDYACWGATRADVPGVSAADGLPVVGSPSSPAQSLLTGTGNNGLSFGNSGPSEYRPELALSLPLVRLDPDAVTSGSGVTAACGVGTSGPASHVAASGFVRTTSTTAATDPSAVESCVVSRASTLSLFPTTFAPRGVVLVELRRATARCRVTGASHTASVSRDYEATVRYWDGASYQTAATITPSTTSDPLAGIDLATTATGDGKFLGDYISSWSALTIGEVTASAQDGQAQVKVPGVVKLVSQPVRKDAAIDTGDPTSAVSLAVGAVSCTAEDAR